jgi:hypothetical protein
MSAAIPSLRARDCPAKEKEALNYLFLAVPLINVTLPLVWKSFAAVWSADVIAFFAMYAWKVCQSLHMLYCRLRQGCLHTNVALSHSFVLPFSISARMARRQ